MKTCGDCTYTGCAQACQEFSTLAKKQGERIADIEKENEKLREALKHTLIRERVYWAALDWIASVNAMDYEYQAVAREAIKRGAV